MNGEITLTCFICPQDKRQDFRVRISSVEEPATVQELIEDLNDIVIHLHSHQKKASELLKILEDDKDD